MRFSRWQAIVSLILATVVSASAVATKYPSPGTLNYVMGADTQCSAQQELRADTLTGCEVLECKGLESLLRTSTDQFGGGF